MPNGLVIGTVIRAYVEFTGKEKRFIVVGFYQDGINTAVILINTDVNLNINYSSELRNEHIFFQSKGRGYLTHDCFVDCTELHPIPINEIMNKFNDKPEICIGQLSKTDLDIVMKKLLDSDVIKGKYKKKIGLFDYEFDQEINEAAE
ncbi:MAG: hypothetical protein ACM31G_07005 [Flavobacteriales bacterium]